MVNTAREQREKEFRELVLENITPPAYVLTKLRDEITESVFKQDKLECFRIPVGVFPHIYKRFGDTKQIEKDLWVVLTDYLKNFPSANRVLDTVNDGGGNPVACRLILCFNLPLSPPDATQTSSPPPLVFSRDA